MALWFVIYGFLAPRFETTRAAGRVAGATALALGLVLLGGDEVRAGTLDRVRDTGTLRVGYEAEARPFSYRDESGKPAGYSIALGQKIAEALKAELGLASLSVEPVAVGNVDRFEAIADGKIDLLCGASTATLERRRKVAFSIPIFPSGTAALLRAGAPERLIAILSGDPEPYRPRWRASLAEVLEKRILSAEAGTTAEAWLRERRQTLRVNAEIVTVKDVHEGVDRVLSRKSDVLFGDRAILLDASSRSRSPGDLFLLARQYTYEPIALAFARGDEDFRLLVDRTLSRLYLSGEIEGIYKPYFGQPDAHTLVFFGFAALPE
jgi:ABC-type amino acid transport substrate-binding protein